MIRSQVDAHRRSAQAKILISGQRGQNPSSIVLVTTALEAVLMADRVDPGRRAQFHPHGGKSLAPPGIPQRQFQRLVDQLHDVMLPAELPDVDTTVTQDLDSDILEPLRLPYRRHPGPAGSGYPARRCDLFRIPPCSLRKSVPIVKVRMLELVDPLNVILTQLGKRFVAADMDSRKEIWKAQLLGLKLFRVVKDLIELREGELSKEELLSEITVRLPMENLENTFGTLVTWGRFGELFAYREDRGVLTPE